MPRSTADRRHNCGPGRNRCIRCAPTAAGRGGSSRGRFAPGGAAPRNPHLVPVGLRLLASLAVGVLALTDVNVVLGDAEPPAEFVCRWADVPPEIDGCADDPAWRHAELIDCFRLPWLGAAARPARTGTRARLLWDREYLYFFAELDDTDLYADVAEPDGQTWDNDVFELFFKPAVEAPGYYELQVSAAGTKLDMFLPRRGAGGYNRFKAEGRFRWQAVVQLHGTLNRWQDTDEGWSVEGRIPWTDFLRTGGRPAVGERWKFALCRYDYSVDFEGPELSTCAPLKSKPFPDFHLYEDYATLRFEGPRPETAARPYGIGQRIALTGLRVQGTPDPPPPFRAQRVYPELALHFPLAVVQQPGTDLLLIVVQSTPDGATRLIRVPDRPDVSEFETLLDDDRTTYSLAFHPDFARNGYVFLGHNGPASGGERHTRVSRFTMQTSPPFALDPASELVIIEWPSDGHNGGAIGFGHDRMLYITSGDGTSDSDTTLAGQDLSHLLAKVLRIDVDHPDPDRPYSVPPDNPFVNLPGARPETWAYGLRNPWRLTVDPQTGHIWVGNNGQDLWEQAYLVSRGANYGWSVMEGSHPFYLDRARGPTPFVPPTLEHPHSEARSLTGGVVYYGQRYPELRGAYIYGDYATGKIWGAKHDGTQVVWHRELADTSLQITGFGLDTQGELLICDHRQDGGLYTLVPNDPSLAEVRFPRRLSETGLFRSVAGHVPEPGLIPYSVNAPLWSDGAYKERYLALPPEGYIEFTRSRAWNFPDGTVLVKSFALDCVQGARVERRWIETRLLVKQQGEWAGYSYIWNEEQTDAELVPAAGLDVPYQAMAAPDAALAAAGGVQPASAEPLLWHYPSRAECMVCHSRAANFVLGLTELQMNRQHDYGGVCDNQLRTLEQLGLLRVNWYADAVEDLRRQLLQEGLTAEAAAAWLAELAPARMQRQPVPSTLLSFPPERYGRLVDPYDPNADLDRRARSYLHANCAQCHVLAGGGNAQMELEYTTPLAETRLIDVPPLHHRFGIDNPRLVAPGDPDRSVLLLRISHRDAGHMPPLATRRVDAEAVALLRAWIASLAAPP